MGTAKKPTILIVDDTPRNIQLLSDVLCEKGYNVIVSNSGAHALRIVNIEMPDLILLDIQIITYLEKNNIEKAKEKARIILNSSNRGHTLLLNLLEWSRSQQGLLSFLPVKIDIHQIVEDCFNLSRLNAENKSIELINNIPANTIVEVDKEQITTVFRNLISNGIKFSKSGSKVEISSSSTERDLEISVIDSGIGMSPGILESIFKVGETKKMSGTSGEKGTGLGLLLCKEFIENHQGNIWVESEPEKGSKFIFSIPLIQSK